MTLSGIDQNLIVKRLAKVIQSISSEPEIITDLTGNLKLKIIYAGEFLDDDGELVEYQDNIKLVRGKQSMNMSPAQCKAFVAVIKENPELRKELNRRLAFEKARIAVL